MSDSGLAADDAAYSAKLVRDTDRPRYYSALFAPERLRRDLFALYALAAEIERVPDQVSEPTLGEMRLRWWQEALEQAVSRKAQGDSPAVRAATATIAGHSLPIAPFASLIEARAADLYADAPATLSDVEGRLGETQSALFQLAAIVAGAPPADSAEPAGHAGIAYGLARRLSTFAAERARGRTIVPMDLLAIEDLKPADIFTPDPPGGVQRTVLALASFARHHLRLARAALDRVPTAAIPAFLPLAVVEPLLRRVERLGDAIVSHNAGLSDLEILVRIGAARLRGIGRRQAT